MAEAVWASFEISNKQSKRWTIPLGFVKTALWCCFLLEKRKRGKIKERRSKAAGGAIPLAAF